MQRAAKVASFVPLSGLNDSIAYDPFPLIAANTYSTNRGKINGT